MVSVNIMIDDPFLVVGAIDIGTAFSGYAFAFTSKPGTIHMNKNWGSEMQCERYKTPTSVLTSPDGKFHSFGYVTEYEYSQLNPDEVKKGCRNTYNLFHHFKMVLYREVINFCFADKRSKLGFYLPFNSKEDTETGPQPCHLWKLNP